MRRSPSAPGVCSHGGATHAGGPMTAAGARRPDRDLFGRDRLPFSPADRTGEQDSAPRSPHVHFRSLSSSGVGRPTGSEGTSRIGGENSWSAGFATSANGIGLGGSRGGGPSVAAGHRQLCGGETVGSLLSWRAPQQSRGSSAQWGGGAAYGADSQGQRTTAAQRQPGTAHQGDTRSPETGSGMEYRSTPTSGRPAPAGGPAAAASPWPRRPGLRPAEDPAPHPSSPATAHSEQHADGPPAAQGARLSKPEPYRGAVGRDEGAAPAPEAQPGPDRVRMSRPDPYPGVVLTATGSPGALESPGWCRGETAAARARWQQVSAEWQRQQELDRQDRGYHPAPGTPGTKSYALLNDPQWRPVSPPEPEPPYQAAVMAPEEDIVHVGRAPHPSPAHPALRLTGLFSQKRAEQAPETIAWAQQPNPGLLCFAPSVDRRRSFHKSRSFSGAELRCHHAASHFLAR
mmetsp:Transcript_59839/g.160193  ORF Transcript_59839/g.160193 Transcript_59839/m.160193 type:complete len:458 (-) Transcript_59839:475-1848(-)